MEQDQFLSCGQRLSMPTMEAVVYSLIMNAVWHRKITVLILAFPMDIKVQLKGEIEHPEIKGLTDIDYMHNIKPKLNQFNIPLPN